MCTLCLTKYPEVMANKVDPKQTAPLLKQLGAVRIFFALAISVQDVKIFIVIAFFGIEISYPGNKN